MGEHPFLTRGLSLAAIMALHCSLGAARGFAQLDTGTILGTITDATGALLPGTTVAVENVRTGVARRVSTNERGAYVAPALPVGTYSVTASLAGFKETTVDGIVLQVGDRINVDVALEPGDLTEAVTVSGRAAPVDTASSTLGGVVGFEQIQDLPINGRSISDFLVLVPGTVTTGNGAQKSVGGAGVFKENAGVAFLLDGVDSSMVAGDAGLENTLGGSQGRLTHASLDAVEEFRVFENSFSAEYGQSLGGVVNLITRSGTNELHGGLFEFLRNDALDARNFFTPASEDKPAFRLNQFGGNLGGPLVRNRAFFLVNYEGLRQRIGQIQNVLVPTQEFRDSLDPLLQPVVDLLPLPNGAVSDGDPRLARFTRGVSDVLDEDTGLVKVDLELSASDKLSIRWNGNTSITEDNFGVARGQIAPADAQLHNVKLGYTKTFGSSLLNEAAFGFNRVRVDPRGSTLQEILDFPLVNIGSGSAGVGPKIFDLLFAASSFTYMDTLSWVKGNHHYKFGAQVVRNQQNKALGLQTIVTFQSLDELAANSPSSVAVLDQPRRGIRSTFYAFFVQDDFKVSRKLTLNLGVRYQYDTAPTEANGVIANFDPATGQVDPPGTTLWDAPKTNLAPRLGFAYAPFDSQRTAIRGGYGWYFSNMDGLSIAQNMPNNVLGGSAEITRVEQPDLKGFPVPEVRDRQVSSVSAAPKDYKAARTQSWNLNIQQAIGGHTVQIGYVGHRGLHLGGPGQDINRVIPGTDRRPLPDFGPITMVRDDLISDYHALQVSFRRPVRDGVGFNVHYTWGHSTDNAPVIFGFLQDDTNPDLDHASSDFDIRHNLVFDYVYELPSAPGLPGWLGSDWQVNGITTVRSGFPVNVICGCDPLGVGQFTGRPNRIADVPVEPSGFQVPDNQLNAEAFVSPEPGTLGTLGRNTERGPKSVNVDLSVFKNFRLRGNHNLQFRAEFFNLLNTPQFANPQSNITSADFGKTLSTISNLQGFGTNRQIQFALRYSF